MKSESRLESRPKRLSVHIIQKVMAIKLDSQKRD